MPELEIGRFPLEGRQLVEASAGTGKTYAIESLYVRLLLEQPLAEPVSADNILVVTFTNAATDELRSRIADRLRNVRAGVTAREPEWPGDVGDLGAIPSRPVAIERLNAALALMDEAAIHTIHGFCARILTLYSLETGVAFDAAIREQQTGALRLAVEDYWRREVATLHPILIARVRSRWKTPYGLQQELEGRLLDEFVQVTPADPGAGALEPGPISDSMAMAKRLWLDEDAEGLIAGSSALKKGTKVVKRERLRAMTVFCEGDGDNIDSVDDWSVWTSRTIQETTKKDSDAPSAAVFGEIDRLKELFDRFDLAFLHKAVREIGAEWRRIKVLRNELEPGDLLSILAQALRDPVGGERLAESICRRYPVALIDEFQDTDPLQSEIFHRIYDGARGCLVMIGDPKQAIYRFRGGDVYTYINAKRSLADYHSLETNWRSTPEMVAAVNRFFGEERWFLKEEDVPYVAVRPSTTGVRRLTRAGQAVEPLVFWHHSTSDQWGDRDRLMATCAATCAELLDPSEGFRVDGETLEARQIAVLVRDKSQAMAARAALLEAGLQSAFLSSESVFASSVGPDLLRILQAALDPRDDGKVRTALATALMAVDPGELFELTDDVARHQEVLDEFDRYHVIWRQQGVMAMLRCLTQTRLLAMRLLRTDDGERMLTDLRHLGELLRDEEHRRSGQLQLTTWFEQQIASPAKLVNEEECLRLESDENLIRIMTMHGVKGLEFDIVMIPLAANNSTDNQATYHRELPDDSSSGVPKYVPEVDLTRSATASALSRQECLEEELRLIYVAFTRARLRCYAGFSFRQKVADNAMAKLLARDATGRGDVAAALASMVAADPALFCLLPVAEMPAVVRRGATPEPSSVVEPAPGAVNQDLWRLTSYTSLVRNRALATLEPGEDDESADEAERDGDLNVADPGDDARRVAETDEGLSRFTFPRGPRIGIQLHSILEKLDFRQGDEASRSTVAADLQRFGYIGDLARWIPVVQDWVTDIVRTPIMQGSTFCLKELADQDRCAEMEFHLALENPFGADAINELMREYGYVSADDEPIGFERLTGVMRGFIDLVGVRDGRYFLIDYKSNYVGPSHDDYAPDRLREVVRRHRYDLQYLLYTVALNRYLEAHVTGYEYDRDFAGCCYLFIRGLDGRSCHRGIYHDRPDAELVSALDRLFGAP